MDSFDEWRRDFAQSKPGRTALSALKGLEKYRDSNDYPELEDRVLRSCYSAWLFEKGPDPLEQRRQQANEIIAQIADQHKAIKTLRGFFRRHSNEVGPALAASLLCLKRKNISLSTRDGTSLKVDVLFDEILAAYEESLKQPILGVKYGPFTHRSQLGCLDYGRAIDYQKARPDAAVNGLLFELVFLFRRWTASSEYAFPFRFMQGEAMPKRGRPCYKQVILLINAALCRDVDDQIDEQLAKDRLTKLIKANPAVGLVAWP